MGLGQSKWTNWFTVIILEFIHKLRLKLHKFFFYPIPEDMWISISNEIALIHELNRLFHVYRLSQSIYDLRFKFTIGLTQEIKKFNPRIKQCSFFIQNFLGLTLISCEAIIFM